MLTLKRMVSRSKSAAFVAKREERGEVDLETEGWNRKINTLPNNLVVCLG